MSFDIHHGDCIEVLRTLPDESVQCCVTSPPYWRLRDYGVAGQLGLERTPEEYVAKMVEVFREVRRVLRKDGTLWLNIGDSYAGSGKGGNPEDSPHQKQGTNRGSEQFVRSKRMERGHGRWGGGNNPSTGDIKAKDLVGIPWMLAFALRSDGWFLRQDIIWAKGSVMPESVTDRCTKSHEYIFLLSKSSRYFYDAGAIAEQAEYGIEARHDRTKEGHRSNPDSLRNGLRPRKSVPRGGFDGKTNELEGREAFRAITETRNKRSVWNINPRPFPEAHFATFPPEIPEICIKAGTKEGDTVLDPFNGAGTTGLVATRLMRNYIGIELNPEYVTMSNNRIVDDSPLFNTQMEQG